MNSQPVQNYADLLDALRRENRPAERIGFVSRPIFSTHGMIVKFDQTNFQVFEYPDVQTRATETQKFIQKNVQIRDIAGFKAEQVHIWSSGRLIVLYTGSDRETTRLLTRLLGAPFAGLRVKAAAASSDLF